MPTAVGARNDARLVAPAIHHHGIGAGFHLQRAGAQGLEWFVLPGKLQMMAAIHFPQLQCSCPRVPNKGTFHRSSASLPDARHCDDAEGAVELVASCRRPEWMAATRAATLTTSGSGSGLAGRRWKNSSIKPVCNWPSWNRGSARISRKKEMLVLMPLT